MMWWPTAAQRQAAIFEREFEKMRDQFASLGRTPPSREAVLDVARRSRDLDPLHVVLETRMRLQLPNLR